MPGSSGGTVLGGSIFGCGKKGADGTRGGGTATVVSRGGISSSFMAIKSLSYWGRCSRLAWLVLFLDLDLDLVELAWRRFEAADVVGEFLRPFLVLHVPRDVIEALRGSPPRCFFSLSSAKKRKSRK